MDPDLTEKAAPGQSADRRVVLVTGPSGAGRSTAINVLEDLGYEAIDNMPLKLVPNVLDGAGSARGIALGIDSRNRDFSAEGLIAAIEALGETADLRLDVLFLDARDDVLLRRYSETRRRHPMAPDAHPETGIAQERALMAPVRRRADTLIDTSDLTVHDLRAEIVRLFGAAEAGRLVITVQSFSYKRGLPPGADMVFDCRFLANPHWQPELRPLDGRHPAVADHVAADPRHAEFFKRVLDLTELLLPAFIEEGKSHLTLAFGCTGGQHRSVALAEALAKALAEDGRPVALRHRELESRRLNERPS